MREDVYLALKFVESNQHSQQGARRRTDSGAVRGVSLDTVGSITIIVVFSCEKFAWEYREATLFSRLYSQVKCSYICNSETPTIRLCPS